MEATKSRPLSLLVLEKLLTIFCFSSFATASIPPRDIYPAFKQISMRCQQFANPCSVVPGAHS